MKIGPFPLANPWILAPMAGVSEMPFRVIALELGAAMAPTELISSKGLQYKNERTQKYLTRSPVEKPFWVQLFGGDPESMGIAAEMAVAAGADMLDINMGCPVKKVTKTGAGSGLLCDTARAQDIVRAMKARVSVPVTCKIRAGWDSHTINCVDVAKALQDAGAAAISLHARTRAQGYSGFADWSLIGKLRNVLTSAALIGNGDVTSRESAERMRRETGCDAVMIGRAALGNPWIFRELHGEDAPTSAERAPLIIRHLREHIAFIGDETRGVRQFRQHAIWYSRGLRGGKLFREQVVQQHTADDVAELIERFFMDSAVEASGMLDNDDVDYKTAHG